MDDETREILNSFVAESREAIDEVEPLLIERMATGAQPDPQFLNRVFRLFHSMKGSAGYLELASIERVTHRAETVLVQLQIGTLAPSPAIVEILCEVLDGIRLRLDGIADTGTDALDGADLEELGERLEIVCAGTPAPAHVAAVAAPAPITIAPIGLPTVAPPRAPSLAEPVDADNGEADVEPGTSRAELVEPFMLEARELLDGCEQALLSVENDPADSESVATAFRALHSFKGNCGFLGYADLERVAHTAETLLGAAQEGQVPRNATVVGGLLGAIDALRSAVGRLPGDDTIPHVEARVEALVRIESEARGLVAETRLGTLLVQRGEITPDDLHAALHSGARPIGDVLAAQGSIAPAQLAEALADQAARRGVPLKDTARPVERPAERPQNSLRVDVGKLDSLMDLVGELIIAETAVIHAPTAYPGSSAQELQKALAQLDRVTRSLQDVAMSLRMVPIEATFRKMVRVVRDVATRQGKQVSLKLEGEETEVDKTVAEIIGDPLVHLLRNAVDHGVEPMEDRIAKGKPPEGTLKLSASHVGGEVWVRIQDDGRGISRTGVLNKAIERGLASASTASSLSDADVYAFIFEPGFSTAQAVTDISGRGVGMDVVKRQIERVKGRIDIASTPDVGTTFTLRIPLTLAIIEGMLVRVGNTTFTIPLLCIRESVVPRAKDVTHISDGQEVVRIRGQLLPVLRLHQFYGLEHSYERLEDGILVVVEDGGSAICLFVDELIGQRQTVIKGLSGFLSEPRALSGCTVLGDGRISLILDVAGLVGVSPRAA